MLIRQAAVNSKTMLPETPTRKRLGDSYAFPTAVWVSPTKSPVLVLQRYPEVGHKQHSKLQLPQCPDDNQLKQKSVEILVILKHPCDPEYHYSSLELHNLYKQTTKALLTSTFVALEQ